MCVAYRFADEPIGSRIPAIHGGRVRLGDVGVASRGAQMNVDGVVQADGLRQRPSEGDGGVAARLPVGVEGGGLELEGRSAGIHLLPYLPGTQQNPRSELVRARFARRRKHRQSLSGNIIDQPHLHLVEQGAGQVRRNLHAHHVTKINAHVPAAGGVAA